MSDFTTASAFIVGALFGAVLTLMVCIGIWYLTDTRARE